MNDKFTRRDDSVANGTNSISTEKVRSKLKSAISSALTEAENTVVRAPTSAGKSYTVATTSWKESPQVTGGSPVVHLSGTSNARDSAAQKNGNSPATSATLKGRHDLCPLANGGHPEIRTHGGKCPQEWFDEMCGNRGVPFSVAHNLLDEQTDDDLPCTPCPAITQWRGVPRTEDGDPAQDVIFGTHEIGRVPALINGCNVVIDEQPDYTRNLDVGDIRASVTQYLRKQDVPEDTWEGFVTTRLDSDVNTRMRHKFSEPNRDWFLNDDDAHILAPGIVQAILQADLACHNRWVGETVYEYPDLNPHTDSLNYQVRIKIVLDKNYDIKILQVRPDFSKARCVIGLDAFPTKPKWRANVLDQISFQQILSREEEQAWRKFERDLRIIQVGDNKNSWTNRGFNEQKMSGLIAELRYQCHNEFRSVITSKTFETETRNIMQRHGVGDPLSEHYGAEKSIESFSDESIGLVAGCISPSSESVKDWLALLEKEATPKRERDDDYTRGQKWVGSNQDIAHALIQDVREQHVLQAVGRFARSPCDSEDGASVYVMTNVLPDYWVDETVADVDVLEPKQREIVSALSDGNGLTASEIEKSVSASRKHVYDTLDQIESQDWISVKQGAGNYNADVHDATRNPDWLVDL